jgi:hypothetical protein
MKSVYKEINSEECMLQMCVTTSCLKLKRHEKHLCILRIRIFKEGT